jgi:RNA polymerase sigma-70 factor (ECF subfamily)
MTNDIARKEPEGPIKSYSLEADFEELFKTHYAALHRYAYNLVQDLAVAEDMVQGMYCKLWERRQDLTIKGDPYPLLLTSVRNDCLNYLKHLEVRKQHQAHTLHVQKNASVNAGDNLHAKEINTALQQAIATMPARCKEVFELSRVATLPYKDIAALLGISVKTVEAQMAKALRQLRAALSQYELNVLWITIALTSLIQTLSY